MCDACTCVASQIQRKGGEPGMNKSQSTPRVWELLDEISKELKEIQGEVSNGNSKLGGVLDDLLMKTEEAKNEIVEGKTSYISLMSYVRMFADLIEIISKLQGMLFYKTRCFLAAFNRERYVNDSWKEHKVIQNNCWA
jgi:hypothetical protein